MLTVPILPLAPACISADSFTSPPRRSALFSSSIPIEPPPSGSKVSNSWSICALGASKPSRGMALRNSFLETVPSPSSSHSRKRSMTRTAFLERMSRSCCATDLPEDSSKSIPPSAEPRSRTRRRPCRGRGSRVRRTWTSAFRRLHCDHRRHRTPQPTDGLGTNRPGHCVAHGPTTR